MRHTRSPIGLGTAAVEKRFRVEYTPATSLVIELAEAADKKTFARTTAGYGCVHLLLIDELVCRELNRRCAELLFTVHTGREVENSVAITSHRSSSG